MIGTMSCEDRATQLRLFETGYTKMLITTNLLQRGVDIPEVKLVINFDIPSAADGLTVDKKSFFYRVGRGGRYGHMCFVVNLVSSQSVLKEITDAFKCEVKQLVN